MPIRKPDSNVELAESRETIGKGFRRWRERNGLSQQVIHNFSQAKKIPLHNAGTPIRNWLHAGDTADAIIKIIESGTRNEIYNISGDYEQSNIDTVQQIIRLSGKNYHIFLTLF